MLKRSFEDAKGRINLCGVAERRSERPLEQRQQRKGAPAETRAMAAVEQSAVSEQSSTVCAGTYTQEQHPHRMSFTKGRGKELLDLRSIPALANGDVGVLLRGDEEGTDANVCATSGIIPPIRVAWVSGVDHQRDSVCRGCLN
jgi:hypothetical protein